MVHSRPHTVNGGVWAVRGYLAAALAVGCELEHALL